MRHVGGVMCCNLDDVFSLKLQDKVLGLVKFQYLDDVRARIVQGLEAYGVPLQPFNGRDCLKDLKEELIDACFYLAQACEEGKKHEAKKLVDDFVETMYAIIKN